MGFPRMRTSGLGTVYPACENWSPADECKETCARTRAQVRPDARGSESETGDGSPLSPRGIRTSGPFSATSPIEDELQVLPGVCGYDGGLACTLDMVLRSR